MTKITQKDKRDARRNNKKQEEHDKSNTLLNSTDKDFTIDDIN